jgi:NAD(P)-dependent dehydrogenase (short-subunit alcohol dehydrogenase family)
VDAALERGDRVAAKARNTDPLGELGGRRDVALHSLDVTDAGQRDATVAAVVACFGRIDVLVNNAGRTQVGAVEETTDEELRGDRGAHARVRARQPRLGSATAVDDA